MGGQRREGGEREQGGGDMRMRGEGGRGRGRPSPIGLLAAGPLLALFAAACSLASQLSMFAMSSWSDDWVLPAITAICFS